jgi:hypothetical protein
MNLNVKVNPGPQRDEVFITSDPKAEEYVNRTIYAKPGLFKDGEFSTKHVEELESKSAAELAEDHAKTVAAEAKEREKATTEAAVAAKKAPTKKEEE